MEPFFGSMTLEHIFYNFGNFKTQGSSRVLLTKTPWHRHMNPQSKGEKGLTRDTMRIIQTIWYLFGDDEGLIG
jgi:hypothetical protein